MSNKYRVQTKSLYSMCYEGSRLVIRCGYNIDTDGIGVYHSHERINRDFRKHLFLYNEEGTSTRASLIYNPRTDHVYISVQFSKRRFWKGGAKTNPSCSVYLGVTIGERVLAEVFENVERMPNGNKGYDFICGRGYKIDVKSACMRKPAQWSFNIRRNVMPDYFLCIAFDNRDDLVPQHLWLIPGEDVNRFGGIAISKSTIDKWRKYELTDKLDEVISCCNTMKS